MYAQLDITHRLNQYVAYSLSGGRTISLAFAGGTIDRYFAHWQANWQIVRKVTLGTSFSYEHGTQLYAGGETYDQYGPGISLSRAITDKLSSSLGYQFYWRDSNQPGRNYTVNVVSLNLNYSVLAQRKSSGIWFENCYKDRIPEMLKNQHEASMFGHSGPGGPGRLGPDAACEARHPKRASRCLRTLAALTQTAPATGAGQTAETRQRQRSEDRHGTGRANTAQ